jgi:hypothetical protein
MDLSKILSITGKPGLYQLISKTKNSFIVESLLDKKRIPAFSHDGVSTLDNIAIFTEEEDLAIEKVFQAIFKKENGAKIPDILNNNDLIKKYFEEVLPSYDKERVYVSNMKKVLTWYNILAENNLIDLEEKVETEPEKPEEKEEEAKE